MNAGLVSPGLSRRAHEPNAAGGQFRSGSALPPLTPCTHCDLPAIDDLQKILDTTNQPDNSPTWWEATKSRFNQTNSVIAKPIVSLGTNVLAAQAGITGASGATGIPTLFQFANGVNGMAAAGSGASLSAVGWTGLGAMGQGAVVGGLGFVAFEIGVGIGSGIGGAWDVLTH